MGRLAIALVLLGAVTPARADDDEAPPELVCREDKHSCLIQATDERYPYCPTIDVATARRIARMRPPADLRELSISAHGPALAILVRSRWLRGVEELRVCTDDRGVRALIAAPRVRPVELEIASDGGEYLPASTVRALVRSHRLGRRLERLEFSGSDSEAEHALGPDAGAAIAAARLPRLHTLDLGYNPLGEDAVAAIVRSPLARRLDRLDLCRTAMGDTVATALEEAALTNLSYLCVSDRVAGLGAEGQTEARARIEAAYARVLDPSSEPADF